MNKKNLSDTAHLPTMALKVALLGAIILLISVGARQSYGLFLTPISTKLDLGRESFSLSIALANLFWGLAAPITGRLSDRYGPFWILIIGSLCFAIGFAGLAIAITKAHLVLCGILMGLGLGATGFTVILGTVGKMAGETYRDKMITLASMGSAFGLFLAIPLTGSLLAGRGLETSLFVIASFIALVGLLAWPFSKLTKTNQITTPPNDSMAYLRHSFSNTNFLLLMIGFFVCGFHIAFTAVHLPAFLEDATGSVSLGSTALMLIGIGNVFGTFSAGLLGDRYGKITILSLIYFLRGFLFLGFLLLPLTTNTVYSLSFLMGVLWLGTVPLTSGLVAQLYGAKWLSMLFGIVFLSHQIGAFFGSWLGGIVFDQTHSYNLMWLGAAVLAFLSALLHVPIKEQYQFQEN